MDICAFNVMSTHHFNSSLEKLTCLLKSYVERVKYVKRTHIRNMIKSHFIMLFMHSIAFVDEKKRKRNPLILYYA